MPDRSAPGPSEQVVAAFNAARCINSPPESRAEAFATNAVYEVDVGHRRLMLKASMNRDALRQTWACAAPLHRLSCA
jgi:hypothetical protein